MSQLTDSNIHTLNEFKVSHLYEKYKGYFHEGFSLSNFMFPDSGELSQLFGLMTSMFFITGNKQWTLADMVDNRNKELNDTIDCMKAIIIRLSEKHKVKDSLLYELYTSIYDRLKGKRVCYEQELGYNHPRKLRWFSGFSRSVTLFIMILAAPHPTLDVYFQIEKYSIDYINGINDIASLVKDKKNNVPNWLRDEYGELSCMVDHMAYCKNMVVSKCKHMELPFNDYILWHIQQERYQSMTNYEKDALNILLH